MLSCDQCGSRQFIALGTLGTLEHFRCQSCGWDDAIAIDRDNCVACDSCEWTGTHADLNDVADLWERVDEDGPEPDGECPDCGALAYRQAPEAAG